MATITWIIVAGLATLAFLAAVDRLPPAWTMVGFLAVAPIALFFRSTGADRASVFSLIKMGAVAAGAAYIQGAKITRWTERPAGRAVGFAILAANILEAAGAEAAQGGFVNSAAGLLLVLTQAAPSTIHVSRGEDRTHLRYPVGGLWVAAYVAWNFAFLYGRNSHGVYASYAAMAVVHLGAPLVAMRGQSDLFVQYRAFALTLMVLLRVTVPYPPFVALSAHWYDPAIAAVLRAISLALALCVAAQAITRARRTRVAGDALGWAALPRS